VVGGLGIEKLQSLMPDIMQTASRTDITPHVRDGYVMMFIYLPVVFTDDFLPYVGPIIPSILKVCRVGPIDCIFYFDYFFFFFFFFFLRMFMLVSQAIAAASAE